MADHLRAYYFRGKSTGLSALHADGDLRTATWCRPNPPLDRGVHASAEYRKLMQSAGFKLSMSRKADCYDDASMESFFHTLKTELVYHTHCATRAGATRDLCLHRRLLQSYTSSLGDRLYQPGRDTAKSSFTLSIFSGEDHSVSTQERSPCCDAYGIFFMKPSNGPNEYLVIASSK